MPTSFHRTARLFRLLTIALCASAATLALAHRSADAGYVPTACLDVARTSDGRVFRNEAQNPDCWNNVLAAVHQARVDGDIPRTAKGRTIIADTFVDFSSDVAVFERIARGARMPGGGYRYVLDERNWRFPTSDRAHGEYVLRAWESSSVPQLQPQALVQARIVLDDEGEDIEFLDFPARDILEAWATAIRTNPLYSDPDQRANRTLILSLSYVFPLRVHHELQYLQNVSRVRQLTFSGAEFDFFTVATLANFPLRSRIETNYSLIPNLSGESLTSRSRDRLQNSDSEGIKFHGRSDKSLLIHQQVDDYLSSLPQEQLEALARLPAGSSQNWRKVLQNVDPGLADLLTDLNSLEIHESSANGPGLRLQSVLAYLSQMVIDARSNSILFTSHLNREGTDRYWGSSCSLVRDACLYVPYLDGSPPGTSFAAPRVAAVLDHIWLLWPDLSKQQLLSVVYGCTQDLGEAGVDAVYGRGLLSFDDRTGRCLLSPTGTLRDRGSRIATSGGLNLPGRLTTSYRAYDDAGRDFTYTAARVTRAKPMPSHTNHALSLAATTHVATWVGASETHAALWRERTMRRHGLIRYGVIYEPEHLLGINGTESFQLQDGYSGFVDVGWDIPVVSAVRFNAGIHLSAGNASGVEGGIVRQLSLYRYRTHVGLSIEPHARSDGPQATFQAVASCDSGASGALQLTGFRSDIEGENTCDMTLSADIRF